MSAPTAGPLARSHDQLARAVRPVPPRQSSASTSARVGPGGVTGPELSSRARRPGRARTSAGGTRQPIKSKAARAASGSKRAAASNGASGSLAGPGAPPAFRTSNRFARSRSRWTWSSCQGTTCRSVRGSNSRAHRTGSSGCARTASRGATAGSSPSVIPRPALGLVHDQASPTGRSPAMTGRPSGTKRRRRPSTPAITSTSLIGSPSSQGAAGRQAAKHPDPGVVIAQSLERLVSGNCYQTQRPSVVVRGQGQDPHVRHVERERRQELVHQVTAIVPGVIRETSLTCVFLRRTSPASTYPVGELRPASNASTTYAAAHSWPSLARTPTTRGISLAGAWIGPVPPLRRRARPAPGRLLGDLREGCLDQWPADGHRVVAFVAGAMVIDGGIWERAQVVVPIPAERLQPRQYPGKLLLEDLAGAWVQRSAWRNCATPRRSQSQASAGLAGTRAESFRKTTTSWPSPANSIAAARPTGPAPSTTMDLDMSPLIR